MTLNYDEAPSSTYAWFLVRIGRDAIFEVSIDQNRNKTRSLKPIQPRNTKSFYFQQKGMPSLVPPDKLVIRP